MTFLALLALMVLPSSSIAQQPSPVAAAAPVDPYQAALGKLKSVDPQTRRQGIEELGIIRDPKVIPQLTAALEDPHVFVRAAAVDALGLLRAPAAGRLQELLNPKKEKEPAVRRSAATALAYIADPIAADSLILALKDADQGVRYAAVRALGGMRVPKSTEALTGFLQDSDVGMRRTVIAALGQIRDPASVGAFLGSLKDSDMYVRLEGVKVLGLLPGPEALEGLRSALSDGDAIVGLQAAMALEAQGRPDGIPMALQALKHDKSFVRQQAASFLGRMGNAPVLSALDAALKTEKDPGAKGAMTAAQVQIRSRLKIAKPAASKLSPSPASKKKRP